MKNIIISLSQIFLNVICSLLFFTNCIFRFVWIGDINGNKVKEYCRDNPFECLIDENLVWLAYIAFILISISYVCSIFSLIKNENKKICKISLITSIVSILFSISLILFLIIVSLITTYILY